MNHPALSVCAWFAAVGVAVALSGAKSRWMGFAGTFLAQLISYFVSLDWVRDMIDVVFHYSQLEARGLFLLIGLTWAGTAALPVGLAHLVFHKRVGVCFWLPIAWGAGEILRFEVMTVNISDWINSQWMVGPILRSLAHLGWWPTMYLCLFACGCIAQALLTRKRWVAAPSVVIAIGLLLLPPIPVVGNHLLRGVAAIHTYSFVDLPHGLPQSDDKEDTLELVVWPEGALFLRPHLGEGKGRGTQISPLIPEENVQHLIGLESTLMGRGAQNQVVAVGPDGRVAASRAKKGLMAIGEKPLFGIGRAAFVPGKTPALMEVAGRPIIPLICGEFLSRSLVAEGRALGGELLVVVARDQMIVNDRAKRQFMAIQLLRSVEFGIPSIRASYGGFANFISSDGRVLAQSGNQRNGLLRWDEHHGARDHDYYGRTIADGLPAAPLVAANTAVLFSKDATTYQTRCPEGRCVYYALENFQCAAVRHVPTVVVAGHGSPPTYLSHSAADLAQAIRCFSPELIVIDTCFGASSELLGALGDMNAFVVAAPFLLPPEGLEYREAFFQAFTPEERAAAVTIRGQDKNLLRWRIHREELNAALNEVAAMDGQTLREHLVRRNPADVTVALGGAGKILVGIDWKRLPNSGSFPRKFKRPLKTNPEKPPLGDTDESASDTDPEDP